MKQGERVFWWGLLVGGLVLMSTWARGAEPAVARLAGPAGTMCAKGERYEAVRVLEEGRARPRWRALCYRGVELEDARNLVGADTSLPNSEGRRGVCMTCPTTREQLEVEGLILLRDLSWRGGWYHGPGRW